MTDTSIPVRYTEAKFYDRGDPASVDFDVGDITTDGSWYDLDLSSIVPAGTKLVLLHVAVNDNVSNSYIMFKKKGNTNSENRGMVRTQVADRTISTDIMVACDDNRVVEYLGSNDTFVAIEITVKGWFK